MFAFVTITNFFCKNEVSNFFCYRQLCSDWKMKSDKDFILVKKLRKRATFQNYC